ncbi:MAG TPA: hypothetical protein VMB50_12055 [Myxococcales bacterium]|nr:hypothetical protein [Myxococcales bacterium]
MTRKFLITVAAAALVGACTNGNGGTTGGNGGSTGSGNGSTTGSGNGSTTGSGNSAGTTGGNNGSSTGGANGTSTGGSGGPLCVVGDAGYQTNCTYDPGFTQTYPNTPNTIGVTYSGETLGVDGLPFIPNLPGDPVFVDGWSVEILESLVVISDIRLDPGAAASSVWQDVGANNTPISSIPTSQAAVYRAGPYVMDAHRASGFLGKDGIEPASGLFLLTGLDNGQPFDTNTLYAWSYQTHQAVWPVTNVNLAPEQLADYQIMVDHGWDKLIKGVATHTQNLPAGQGGGSPTQGTYPDPTIEAKFEAMPQTVYFAFGYDDHTQMWNCVNPDNAIDNDPSTCPDSITCLAARGVQTNNNGTYIAQITLHQDHVFWDTLEHEGEPLRFDPIAAYAPGDTSLNNPFWINNLTSQKLATTFADGTPLPDRGPYMQGNTPNFDVPSDMTSPPLIGCNGTCGQDQVIFNPNGATTVPPTNYPDFMEFSVQSQTHLNAQGICYIEGQHAADPFFTPNVQSVPYGDPECTLSTGCGTPPVTDGGVPDAGDGG